MRTLTRLLIAGLLATASFPALAEGPEPEIKDPPPVKSQEPSKPTPEDPAPTDKTSKTCIPTVPMLQNIPCEKYPAKLQAFCQKYKPLQMNDAECQAAEKYAESAPPEGPKKEECEKQTFGRGTSSWSYVLACAKVSANQGEKGDGSKTNGTTGSSTGPGKDPECVNRLKGRGVEFENLGEYNNTSGGRSCTIPQAVALTGKAVSYGQKLTMDCTLAEKMEDFGQKMQGLGVTRYTVIGTIGGGCRGINNSRVTGGTKTSLHGSGHAIDINGYFMNGKLLKTSEWFSNPGSQAILGQIRSIACETFMGVLAFNFYRGSYTHTHYQVKERTRCDPPG